MWQHMKFKSTNGSGSLAAAYLIFFTGLVGCTLCTGLLFRQAPEIPFFVLVGGGVLALVTLMLKVRCDLPSDRLRIFSRTRPSAAREYVPRLVKSPPKSFGTNRPPTVEEVRDLKDNPRNWVPSRTRSGRSSLRRR